MGDVAVDLVALGATVEWPDAGAAAQARQVADPRTGRLAECREWLAAAQACFPPQRPSRARALVFGPVSDAAGALAAELAVALRRVEIPDDADAALGAGVTAADEALDLGADLLVVAAPPSPTATPNSAVAVSVLTGAEPVALLPRGAAAVDTAAWIATAQTLRERRRELRELRTRPDELLTQLTDPTLASLTGFLLRAVARRTPLVLDGGPVLAAALIAYHLQARAGRWWRVATTSPDRVHTRAATELGQQPLLDLELTADDATAGLLCIPVLHAAALAGSGQSGSRS